MSESGLRVAEAARCKIAPRHAEFAQALLAGLSAHPKHVSSKYFYDREGSALFDRICELPEYYPTRTETALLRAHAGDIARLMGRDVTLIEYGAGALKKVGLILNALDAPRAYVPVDISGDFLRIMAEKFKSHYPSLEVRPVTADFTKQFSLSLPFADARRIGFFPGSTIGNLDRKEAIAFLKRAATQLRGGGLLIGVDLIKDPAILHAAYNDSAGVTEAFNKNLLLRANLELDTNFDPDNFAHYAYYNPTLQRVEMHLMSLLPQTVAVCGRDIAFAEGETIHTENSHKYTVEGFQALAQDAGFTPRAVWCDEAQMFSLHWLEARNSF